MPSTTKRRAKGAIFIALVKLLKHIQRTKGLPAMSERAAELLETRVLASEWYALEGFLDLLDVTDSILFKGDETKTLELGATGAMDQLKGSYRAYTTDDPCRSVYALRHAWRPHYDFGELTAVVEGERTVQFCVTGYPDIRMPHALSVASWGIASARLAGVEKAKIEVLERPWRGGNTFRYLIQL